jgi:para-nitrobenzyl esterase
VQIIKTDKGYVSGTTIGKPGNEVSIFRGIPFAAPPVGELRWKPPQPAVPWDDIRECTKFSAISPQMEMPGMPSPLPLSEDCLYLNVLTPARQPNEKLPVMVWMHGGGYSVGSGNDRIWNNYRLPQCGVVVVTLNHRLAAFGLLAHPALSKESSKGVSGNYLFLDLIASLQWIQKNIAAFGGDPDNVTIFGESGGGAKVSVMMSSPLAKGLFHRAICESGKRLTET